MAEKGNKNYVQENIDDLIPPKQEDSILPQKEENKPNQEVDENDAAIVQKKKLDEVEQSVSKHYSKKNKILNILFFCINIVVVAGILIYQLLKEDLRPIADLKFDIGSLFILILFFILVIASETLVVSYLLKQSTGRWRVGIAYKVAELGKYYDCVTPMATGGQPFQISYLKSHGTPVHTALSIPLAKYVFSQIAWVILSFICLVISWTDKSYGTFVSITSVIGFVLSSFLLFVTIFLSVCKSVGRKLVVKSLKFLHKIKIVKNYDKQYEKITKYINDFQDIMKQYAKSPKDFLIMLFLSLLKNFINYSMPFFIVRLFMADVPGAMYFKLFVMTILVDLSASFFPLPGGTGMNEISFSAAFTTVMQSTSCVAWVLIVWRILTYYAYLLQGVCILSYDFAYGNRKYKWQVIKERLAEESEIFKQEQIDKFRADRAKRRKNKNKSSLKEYL